MTTPQDDVDALFDTPATPSRSPAADLVPPGLPFPAPSFAENRREHRVKVSSWPARVQLPAGQVLELRVRDISESGVGLLTERHIPPASALNFAMGVPDPEQPGRLVPVSGTIRTSYIVVQGRDLSCGAQWVSLPSAGRELLEQWMRKLRR